MPLHASLLLASVAQILARTSELRVHGSSSGAAAHGTAKFLVKIISLIGSCNWSLQVRKPQPQLGRARCNHQVVGGGDDHRSLGAVNVTRGREKESFEEHDTHLNDHRFFL